MDWRLTAALNCRNRQIVLAMRYFLGASTKSTTSSAFSIIEDIKTADYPRKQHFSARTASGARQCQLSQFVGKICRNAFDTVMHNYNWQIWNTAAYSIYAGTTDIIDKNSAKQTWLSIIRFLSENGLVKRDVFPGYKSQVLEDKDFTTITAPCAGIFYKLKSSGSEVRRSETIAKILDPYNGSVLAQISAPKDGVIFFAHSKALIMEKTAAFQVV